MLTISRLTFTITEIAALLILAPLSLVNSDRQTSYNVVYTIDICYSQLLDVTIFMTKKNPDKSNTIFLLVCAEL